MCRFSLPSYWQSFKVSATNPIIVVNLNAFLLRYNVLEKFFMKLDFDKMGGLIPAIIQDAATGKVLMLAYMNTIAWEKTLETGKAWFYSRSRDKQWMKGEESGNVQIVNEVLVDCDDDTVLLKVKQVGKAACHKGYTSCFFRKIDGDVKIVEEKVFDPEKVYKK